MTLALDSVAADNKRILEHAYSSAAKGDSGPLFAALAENVRWTVMGSSSWSGTYEGTEDLAARLIEPLMQRLAGPLVVQATRFVAEGDIVIVEATIRNSTVSGRPYPNRYCNLFRLEAGHIVEAIEYADTVMMEEVLGPKPGPGDGAVHVPTTVARE